MKHALVSLRSSRRGEWGDEERTPANSLYKLSRETKNISSKLERTLSRFEGGGALRDEPKNGCKGDYTVGGLCLHKNLRMRDKWYRG